jgi:hypothetical protein
MTENVGNRERLNWLLLEGVAIVVSILMAFWIDAWWDQRKDHLEEREILIGLEIEFEDLRARLDRWVEVNNRRTGLINQFLSESVVDMNLQSIEQTLASASIANVLDQGGALEALINSGRLERISDRDLRGRLLKMPDWLDDIHTNDLSIRGFTVNQIQPFLAKRGFPRTNCKDWRYVCSEQGPIPDIYLQLAKNLEFRSLLIIRRGWAAGAMKNHARTRSEADAILGVIREQLALLEQ